MVLPPDYPNLSEARQRAARLEVVKCRTTVQDYVDAWNFFCSYYLDKIPGSGAGRLPPGVSIYRDNPIPSPTFHEEMIRNIAESSNKLSVTAAPRGSAKTTVLQTWALLQLLTQPGYKILVVRMTDYLVKIWNSFLLKQLTFNPLIAEDFGDMKPKRGDATWSAHIFTLKNHSELIGTSLGAQMLGLRPDLILLDDPEFDPEATNKGLRDVRKASRQLETLVFDVMLPMLLDPAWKGSKESRVNIYWIGTMLDRKSLIFQAVRTKTDRRFKRWARKNYTIFMRKEDHPAGTCEKDGSVLLWEEMWDWEKIKDLQDSMSPASFRKSFMNDPQSDDELTFRLHDEWSYYSSDIPVFAIEDPLKSVVSVKYVKRVPTAGHRYEFENRKEECGQLFGRMSRILLVDYATGMAKKDGDFSAIVVLGFDESYTLWVLDCWAGRVMGGPLIEKIWELGSKWQVVLCGIESVSTQKQLLERARATFAQLREYGNWVPRIVPVTDPYNKEKGEKIMGLGWRFDEYQIRLPAGVDGDPTWRMFFQQIQNFTPDLSLLEHDDLIDALSMHQHLNLPGGLPGLGRMAKKETAYVSPMEKLEAGIMETEDGIPYLSAVSACELTEKADSAILHAQLDEEERLKKNDGPDRVFWERR